MTPVDTESPVAQVAGWLGEGYATWGALIGGRWVEYPVQQAGAHVLAPLLERRLPERRAAA